MEMSPSRAWLTRGRGPSRVYPPVDVQGPVPGVIEAPWGFGNPLGAIAAAPWVLCPGAPSGLCAHDLASGWEGDETVWGLARFDLTAN